MKLLDEETILMAEYPTGVADGPQEALQYVLSNYNSAFGTAYKVVRIPSPPSVSGNYPNTNGYYRTYTNSVFVNNTVLVPSTVKNTTPLHNVFMKRHYQVIIL